VRPLSKHRSNRNKFNSIQSSLKINSMSTTALPGQVEVVFPGSPLTQIQKTTDGLNKYICRIAVDLKSGGKAHGTGIFINRYYVLTAAHNVANATFGDAARVTVVPGQNGEEKPLGSFVSTTWHIPDEYRSKMPPYPAPDGTKDYSKYLYDYALIELEQPALQQVAVFPQVYRASVEQLTQVKATIKGYPGNKPDGTMWEASGKLTINDQDTQFLFYQISTYGGDSGAGVLSSLLGETYIAGVHVAGSNGPGGLNSNYAVRVSDEMLLNINKWIKRV
jgi:glutamyl endopeptidase